MDEMEVTIEDLKESVDEAAEEMDEGIHVEEDDMPGEGDSQENGHWKEEIKVAGEELLNTVKKLLYEANVRRVIIKNSDGKTLFEIPLIFGVAGIALLPTLAAVGLVGALLTDCTITVIREAKPEAEEPEEV
jgi:hypothetical protein